MEIKIKYTTLTTDPSQKLTLENKKSLLPSLYRKTNWQKQQHSGYLHEVIQQEALIVISTETITVIDFDTNESFNQAIQFNQTLQPEYQCQFIVKSLRKGGHFYFTPNPDIDIPVGHTKQSVLDILTTEKHNVIAPTSYDQGKKILFGTGKDLTQYSHTFNHLVSYLVISNLSEQQRQIMLKDDRHSDNAKTLVKGYLANIVAQQQFNEFYNLPDPIPAGQSNQVYLSLSTRLGSDKTVNKEDYMAAMEKFNTYHNRKTKEELRSEIIYRMLPNTDNQSLNGLWQYEDKPDQTYIVPHRIYNTPIETYYNQADNSYIVYFRDNLSNPVVQIVKNSSVYIDLMEKISTQRSESIRRNKPKITPITLVHDYKLSPGYNPQTYIFNKAFTNSNLTAFAGKRPPDYEEPTRLLELMQYMWGDEYDYLLTTTKYRYTTFKFSPVVTYLKGTEGSGKDLTIALLTAGFSKHPQQLNYSLLKDKHSNWQIEENVVLSEIGSWRPMERDDLLASIKTISGSNGMVTFRDMQKTATVVPTLVKIWITANEWIKLHTDPVTQRRIHIVFMPKPLEQESGGPYSSLDMQNIVNPSTIMNFYYWLGNVYDKTISPDKYMNAISRQQSQAYMTYIDNTQSLSDRVANLLWEQRYPQFMEALELFSLQLSDFTTKRNKQGNLVITLASLKDNFGRNHGGDIINKTLDRLSSDREGGKRLKFDRSIVEKYITIYEAPKEQLAEAMDIDPL